MELGNIGDYWHLQQKHSQEFSLTNTKETMPIFEVKLGSR